MKLFLAASSSRYMLAEELSTSPYILESFYYFKGWQLPLLKSTKMFLLDSGAFTFMSGNSTVDWDAYVTRYIDFIKANGIKYFFELDIDSVVGYERVRAIRKRIEAETGRQCIPVWHKSRGADEYLRLCDEYSYIAIGGFAIGTIKKQEYRLIPRLINVAAARGTKVHGLGFTPSDVEKYGFFSVDSSTWSVGAKYGNCYHFTNGAITYTRKPEGKRIIKGTELDRYNLVQWIKYQKYLDRS